MKVWPLFDIRNSNSLTADNENADRYFLIRGLQKPVGYLGLSHLRHRTISKYNTPGVHFYR